MTPLKELECLGEMDDSMAGAIRYQMMLEHFHMPESKRYSKNDGHIPEGLRGQLDEFPVAMSGVNLSNKTNNDIRDYKSLNKIRTQESILIISRRQE